MHAIPQYNTHAVATFTHATQKN